MKLAELVAATNIISTLGSKEGMKFQTVYKFAKFMHDTEGDVKFYNEQVQKLFTDFGVGPGESIPEDKQADFNAKLVELQETEIADPKITFTPEELENSGLTLAQTYALLPFIKEEV